MPEKRGETDSDIGKFVAAAKIIREIGMSLLSGPIDRRKELRHIMNTHQNPELHETFDVLHRLLKEKRGE